MAVKKKPAKKVEDPSPIGDYLNNREVRKYGPHIVGGEANYMPGDMSKANRIYQEGGFAVRSTLEQLKSFMRGGGLRNSGK
jgi:hypothetical protein